jgi:hypothetical protein
LLIKKNYGNGIVIDFYQKICGSILDFYQGTIIYKQVIIMNSQDIMVYRNNELFERIIIVY